MTIEYSLTRAEVVRGFFLSVNASPKYRGMILLNSAIIGALLLVERVALYHSFTPKDVLIAMAKALGVLAFIPPWLFIRAKTAKRTLTASQVMMWMAAVGTAALYLMPMRMASPPKPLVELSTL